VKRTPLLFNSSVTVSIESSLYSEYACGSSRLAPRSGTKLKHALQSNIKWAELQFPPINLWVMASLSYDMPSEGATAHIHRRQRPGLNAVRRDTNSRKPNALHKLHRRLESLLAMRGGKV